VDPKLNTHILSKLLIKQNEIEFVENKETNYYDNKNNEMSEKNHRRYELRALF
jgi:hypothetical protein